MQQAPPEFKRGDIVWAQVRGYSWWPAKVGEVIRDRNDIKKDRKYRVDFIGDNTHQTLPSDKVVDFVENFFRLSETKKRDLLDSIDLAKRQLRREDLQALEKRQNKQKIGEKGGIIEVKEAQ